MFGRVNARLIDQLYVLFTKDSLKLMRKFNENRQQLNSLMNLVNAIKKGEPKKIKEHADKFVEQYGAYTPKVSKTNKSVLSPPLVVTIGCYLTTHYLALIWSVKKYNFPPHQKLVYLFNWHRDQSR
jgi:hypothetical protein